MCGPRASLSPFIQGQLHQRQWGVRGRTWACSFSLERLLSWTLPLRCPQYWWNVPMAQCPRAALFLAACCPALCPAHHPVLPCELCCVPLLSPALVPT